MEDIHVSLLWKSTPVMETKLENELDINWEGSDIHPIWNHCIYQTAYY